MDTHIHIHIIHVYTAHTYTINKDQRESKEIGMKYIIIIIIIINMEKKLYWIACITVCLFSNVVCAKERER